MNWLCKIAQVEYLQGLGAPQETTDWIMSQPQSAHQFYVNQFRQDPSLDWTAMSQLQPKQRKRKTSGPTQRELQHVRGYEGQFQQWALSQLRLMRVKNVNSLTTGEMDYSYSKPMGVFDNKLRQIHDWFSLGGQNINIASLSWDQAWHRTDQWHKASAGQGEGLIYEPTNPQLVVFNPPEWKGWSMQKVTSENDLLTEGNMMSHCVGDHCRNVQSGVTEVYSLRDAANKPHVTIGIDVKSNEIIEIKGHSNSDPKEEYQEYITQWFKEFQKERPGLRLYTDEMFDFNDMTYEDNMDVDRYIDEKVSEEGAYGLEKDYDELDVQDIYDNIVNMFSGQRTDRSDTRNVQDTGVSIAEAAWKADRYRAQKAGLLDRPYTTGYGGADSDAHYLKFKRRSSRYGVDWLYDKIDSNNTEFYTNMDYFESSYSVEDFETEEEYEEARMQEESDYMDEIRSSNIPYALDDVIVSALSQLAREEPFLEEHKEHWLKRQSSWLGRVA